MVESRPAGLGVVVLGHVRRDPRADVRQRGPRQPLRHLDGRGQLGHLLSRHARVPRIEGQQRRLRRVGEGSGAVPHHPGRRGPRPGPSLQGYLRHGRPPGRPPSGLLARRVRLDFSRGRTNPQQGHLQLSSRPRAGPVRRDGQARNGVGPLGLAGHERGLRQLDRSEAGAPLRPRGPEEPEGARRGGGARSGVSLAAPGRRRRLPGRGVPDGVDGLRGDVHRLSHDIQPRRRHPAPARQLHRPQSDGAGRLPRPAPLGASGRPGAVPRCPAVGRRQLRERPARAVRPAGPPRRRAVGLLRRLPVPGPAGAVHGRGRRALPAARRALSRQAAARRLRIARRRRLRNRDDEAVRGRRRRDCA